MKPSFDRNGPRRWPIYFLMGSRKNNLIGIKAVLLAIILYGSLSAQTPLSLETAIRLSDDHSFTVKAARSDSLTALYDLGASRALRYPSVSLTATSFYINKLQSINLPFSSMTIGAHNNYQADLKLTLPIWTGGRIGGQVDVQTALFEARGANLEAARLSNAYNTRKAYLSVISAGAMLNAAHASSDRVRMILNDTQDRFRAGSADSVDILGAELALLRIAQLETERNFALDNARQLLGKLLGMEIVPGTVYDSIPQPNEDAAKVKSYEVEPPTTETLNRPELVIYENRARASDISIGLSRAGYLPNISGFGGYSAGKPNKDIFGNKWNDYWNVGLNLNWDFNLGNRIGKTVSSAKAAASAARSQKEDIEESLLLQAKTAWNNLTLAFQNYDYSRSQFEIARKQYALGQEKQKAGALSLNRLLELVADLSSSEQLFRASTINYYIAETEYLYAIGSPRIYGGIQR